MGVPYALALSVFYLASGIFIFLLGLTILRSGRSSAPTRATALMLFFAGVGPILSATGIIVQGTLRQDAVLYRSMVENFEYLWEFYFPSLLLFSLAFPRESRLIPSFGLLGLLIFAPYLFHLVTIMFGDGMAKSVIDLIRRTPLADNVSLGERTFSIKGATNIFTVIAATLVNLHKQLFLIVNIVYASLAVWVLSRNMRWYINPRVTGQLRTVFIGMAVSLAAYVLAKLLPLVRGGAPGDLSLALINFSLVVGGGSVGYAVVKQRFLGIKYVARKSILYGAATVLFAVIYLMVVKPVSDYFGQYSLVSREAFETGFIIMAIIAFQPLLLRIEESLEKLLFKGKDDLQTKFRKLGSTMANVADEEELERRLATGFRNSLDATWTKLHVDTGDSRLQRLVPVLEKIGEPVTFRELTELGEKGRLPGSELSAGGDGAAAFQGGCAAGCRARPGVDGR